MRRRCVACGYDGPEVGGPGSLPHCPECGCDLALRPPRSYIEMEGIEDPRVAWAFEPVGLRPAPRLDAAPRPSLVLRWVLFACLVLGGFVLGGTLLSMSWPG